MNHSDRYWKRHPQQRGVTLVEVLIVVAIMALVASGVGVAVIARWNESQNKTTATNARAIRGAVKTWWLDHDAGGCPSVDELVLAGTLDRDSPRVDAWGESWRVECAEGEVSVLSPGRDRQIGTADDIRIPPV
jgi:general secretion pathway protein G